MSTHYEHYKSGRVYGIYYIFEHKGDGLPHHMHGTDLAHNIIVLTGSVRLEVEGEPSLELKAGHIHDFAWEKRHVVYALEDNTCVLNLILNGMPPGYDTLPPSELRGQFDCRTH